MKFQILKPTIATALTIALFMGAVAQNVSKQAVFPGGNEALGMFVTQNTTYPESAILNQISGEVVVQVMLDEMGEVISYHLSQGLGYGCDKEAIKIVESLPTFSPAHDASENAISSSIVLKVPFPPQHKENEPIRLEGSAKPARMQSDKNIIYSEFPTFPGGQMAMIQFINNNLEYPFEAIENGAAGEVLISFDVELDGSITNIKAVRGIGLGCDQAAIDVVKKMPRWFPGWKKGDLVKHTFYLPLEFGNN